MGFYNVFKVISSHAQNTVLCDLFSINHVPDNHRDINTLLFVDVIST